MALVVKGTVEAPVEREVLAPGSRVDVHRCRGRLPTRAGMVIQVGTSDGLTHGSVIAVRWNDDGSVSYVVPCTDIHVSGPV
jgi:hypothetical protein